MLFNSLRDTPVLNIRELAKNPIEKTGPKRAITLILIMFFSVGINFSIVLPAGALILSLSILKKKNKYLSSLFRDLGISLFTATSLYSIDKCSQVRITKYTSKMIGRKEYL
ncbi:MAG: hypothetical protein IIC75_09100, partial [Bacteroidetes bacterium]|nr:hypothetical protein [Bacteroidota bacterium]